jgi:hypothetical protein
MHITSRATGKAIANLLNENEADIEEECARYAESARVGLCLDNSSMIAAMMFAQDLIVEWSPRWKYAYTIGLVLGAKYTTEGFYLGDIIAHLTEEFPLDAL